MRVRRIIGVAASALAVCASGAAAQTPTPDPAPLPEPPAPLSVPSPPPVVEPTQAPSVNSTRTGSRKADKSRLEHKSRLNEIVRLPLHPPDAGVSPQVRKPRLRPISAEQFSSGVPPAGGFFSRVGGVLVLVLLVAGSLLVAWAALPERIYRGVSANLGADRGEVLFGGFAILLAIAIGMLIPFIMG